MLQSVLPSQSHSIVNFSREKADSWGRVLNPSIAHFIQGSRVLSIDCPNTVLEATAGIAQLPHVMDLSTIRLHVSKGLELAARREPERSLDAVLGCMIGDSCELKIWGLISPEDAVDGAPSTGSTSYAMAPTMFSLVFWEVSRVSFGVLPALLAELMAKENRIRKLEMQVALSMCSQ